MKPHIDLFETFKGLFIASHRLKNRFKRYWGTTYDGDVEVFNKRMIVWPGTDGNPNVVKILKMFGMYTNVKNGEFEGIENYYLWLNPAKGEDFSDISKDIVVNHLNSVIPDTPFQVIINYIDMGDPARFNGYTGTQIGNWLLNNYSTISTSHFIEVRGNTLVAEAVGYYLPLDTAGNFTASVVEASVMPSAYQTAAGLTAYHSSISVEFLVRQISPMQADDHIVDAILNETDTNRKNKISTVFGLDEDTDDENSAVWLNGGRGGIWANFTNRGANKTDELWYNGQLRTAVLDSTYVDRDYFAVLLAGSMDTGYTKKKTSWWKKLLSIVIVIIAVVLSVVSGGSSLTLMQFAFNLGIAALALTVIQFAIAQSGDIAWAEYFGKFVRVVSLVSLVAGVASFIQNTVARIAQKVAETSIAEAISSAVQEAVSELTTAAKKFAEDASIGSALEVLGTKIVSVGRMLAEKLMDMRVDTARSDLNDTLASVQQSKEELADLTDKEVDIGVEDIKFYTQPLKLDNLPFEVDYLYEGTRLNIGRPSFVPTGLNIIDKQSIA